MRRHIVRRHIVLGLLVAATAAAATVTLTAPESVPAGSEFGVDSSGAPANGHVVQVRLPDGKRGSYGYPSVSRPVMLTAPVEAGDYRVDYVIDGEVVASKALAVTAVTATLRAPQELAARQEFEVAFEGPGNKQDVFEIRGPRGEKPRHDYDYAHGKKSGTVKMTAPEQPGDYTVLYYTFDKELARIPIRVTGVTASLKVPATVPAGSDFEVGFSGPANRGDMILVELKKGERGAYRYPQQHENGVLPLTAPEALGKYDVVYQAGDTELARQAFEVVAVTASLTAPDEVEGGLFFDVAWKAEGNRGDRIDLFSKKSADPIAWDYPIRGNPVQIQAPIAAGDYELRYRTPAGNVLATRPIKVSAPDPDPGFLRVTAAATASFPAGSGVEIIVDASGSMLQKIGGKRRIAVAKETLTGLLGDVIPAGTPFALRVFGHRQADSCRTDLEIPLAPLSPAAAKAKVAAIEAMNLAKTPIGASLAAVSRDMAAVTGERIVILLTDGEETCDGDPAAAIRALEKSGVDVRVNIVGFAIDDEALRTTFESWAALGNGAYFDAADAEQLGDALTRSVRREFAVVDAAGKVVARGRVGDERISLPAGSYGIRVGGDEKAAATVEVKPKATAAVELK